MTLDEFWNLVDRVHIASNGDMSKKCDLLTEELEKLSPEEVLSFAHHFDDCEDITYTWDLWAAAYIIGGGCSDDCFSDFRSSLISMGRAYFERIIASPDDLAEMDDAEDTILFEGYQYISTSVYKEMTGELPMRQKSPPGEPLGEHWDDDDLPRLYPRLSARYDSDDMLD
ncbi:MAG: DUF4240 domain-containing protein [Anaerolineae bacterium]|nr:DUF4240 domain-containing protein [Anaerolineae bacterium]